MQMFKTISLIALIAAGYAFENVQAATQAVDETVQACSMPIAPTADLQNITIGTNP